MHTQTYDSTTIPLDKQLSPGPGHDVAPTGQSSAETLTRAHPIRSPEIRSLFQPRPESTKKTV